MKKIGLWIVGIGIIGTVTWAALGALPAGSATPPAANVREALLQALAGPDGEYAAYASYAAVLETYGAVEPYGTIAAAELRHIAALERLLNKYGIDYPETNPYLGTIETPSSLEDAARAWVAGEIANVALYDGLLPIVANYPDITRVFGNLRGASLQSHLPAFERAAESGGILDSTGHGGEGALTGRSRSGTRRGRAT